MEPSRLRLSRRLELMGAITSLDEQRLPARRLPSDPARVDLLASNKRDGIMEMYPQSSLISLEQRGLCLKIGQLVAGLSTWLHRKHLT